MTLLDGFGIAETAVLFLLGLGKFVYAGIMKQLERIEHRMEKMDDKYREVTRELYTKFDSKDQIT